MLSIFSTPKPFVGHINIIQRNAIKSWTLLHPEVEVILFGDEEGTAEVCQEFGLRHEQEVERNEHGTKLLGPIFSRAQQITRHNYLCYANCDIMLTSDFRCAFEQISSRREPILMSGQRWDVDLTEPWDFSGPNWERRLMEFVRLSGRQRPPEWIDYFLFSRGLYKTFPLLVIGRVYWDRWLIWAARSQGIRVVNASNWVKAVHQNHDYSYHKAGAEGVWSDEQAQQNFSLAGGEKHLYTLEDATHLITPQGVQYNFARHISSLRRSKKLIWFSLLDGTRPVRHRLGLRQGLLARVAGKDDAVV
jgi:hypothetical protein